MKLLLVTLFIGACVATEFVDREYVITLKKGVSVDRIRPILAKHYVDMIDAWDFPSGVIVHVAGSHMDVHRVGANANVVLVERNQIYHTQQCSSEACPEVWGLDRIDQNADLPYNTPGDPDAVYSWGANTGSGVDAYIIDTGIMADHSDFEGRVTSGWDFHNGDSNADDDNGHGTHCAGTIGSRSYGVAKASNLWSVKVLGRAGSGSTTNVIAGIDWVRTQNSAGDKSVASLSLGGGASNTMDNAIADLHDDGCVVVVAAGNSDADACNTSPAREPKAITVGASDVRDSSASFTNYGSCVDVFAPGVDIKSTWNNGGTNTISGTSMACPHVAGVVARYQSSQGTAPSPDAVAAWITANATPNTLTWNSPAHGTSPNLLAYGPCSGLELL